MSRVLCLQATFATRSRDQWEVWFQGRDVCFAPVLDLQEAFHRPQIAARQMLVRDDQGNLHIGIPIKFRDEPGQVNPDLPALGQHTDDVLRQAGLPEGLIADVRKAVL